MKDFNEKVIVITGTASGIGRHLAIQLAAEGAKVIATDINEEGLDETCNMIKEKGGHVWKKVVDVSKREQVYDLADRVVKKYGYVDGIINNAGVALGVVTVEDVTYEEMEWIFGINLWGVIYGTKAFLPHLKNRPEAAIVNISSVFGLAGFYKQGPYCITKFGVRGFTETLRTELEETNVLVMQVHPGGIKTNIAKNARHATVTVAEDEITDFNDRFDEAAKTTAEDAAKTIINGLRKNNTRVLIGNDARFIDKIVRWFPKWGLKKLAKMSRRYEEGGKFIRFFF